LYHVVHQLYIIRRAAVCRRRPIAVVSVLPGLGVVGVVGRSRRARRSPFDDAAPETFAGAAADVDVRVAEHVRHDLADVGQAQQHERDSEHGVCDADQPTPERLRCNVTVT